MKLNVSFQELRELIKYINISPVVYKTRAARLATPEVLEKLDQGKEVLLSQITIDTDGVLNFGGETIVLYIKNTNLKDDFLSNSNEGLPRLHFANCSTLSQVESGRFIATNNFLGGFLVKSNQMNSYSVRLKPCKNCLVKTNYRNYNYISDEQKLEVWRSFSLFRFFSTYGHRVRIKR